VNVVCIIQARLASTRLPRKLLADVGGRTVLQLVLQRARAIDRIGKVGLAVPENEVGELHQVATDAGAEFVFGGHPTDVLQRYADCARTLGADVIVRITGDCPLLAPRWSSEVVRRFLAALPMCQYGSNLGTGAIDGFDTEIFTRRALERAHREAVTPADREHVTPWMRRELLAIELAWCGRPLPKLSIDTAEDLARVRAIVSRLPSCGGLVDDSLDALHAALREVA